MHYQQLKDGISNRRKISLLRPGEAFAEVSVWFADHSAPRLLRVACAFPQVAVGSLHSIQRPRVLGVGVEGGPGFVPWVLRDAEIGPFRADDCVFDAMIDVWRAQMLARGLDDPDH